MAFSPQSCIRLISSLLNKDTIVALSTAAGHGAIAVIRTALNFFLSKEMQQERRESGGEEEVLNRAKRD